MNKTIAYLLGLISGAVLTLVVLAIIGVAMQNNTSASVDPIQYLEHPESYENKSVTSFKILQVLGNGALANEVSDKKYDMYLGNTVYIIGENFYTDQVVEIKNPQRIGTYRYTTKGERDMAVPVLKLK